MTFSFKKYHVTFHSGLVLVGLGKSTRPVEGLIPLENKSLVNESTDKTRITFIKLTSVYHVLVLLLIINFVITLSK